MGVGAGLYMHDVVVKEFTFPISHRALKPRVIRCSRNHSMPVDCSQYDYHVPSSGLQCPPSTVAEAVGIRAGPPLLDTQWTNYGDGSSETSSTNYISRES